MANDNTTERASPRNWTPTQVSEMISNLVSTLVRDVDALNRTAAAYCTLDAAVRNLQERGAQDDVRQMRFLGRLPGGPALEITSDLTRPSFVPEHLAHALIPHANAFEVDLRSATAHVAALAEELADFLSQVFGRAEPPATPSPVVPAAAATPKAERKASGMKQG
jgi:hypothetical protein